MNNIKNIVVASNPFGFGPTANAIPILEELRRRFSKKSNVAIYFVGSDKCQEIVPDFTGVNKIILNERDENELMSFLNGLIGEIIVIGVQNRFIVAVGNAIGCKTVFFDTLAWMWTEISRTHLVADEIFWMRFPGIFEKHKKYSTQAHNIRVIGGVYKKTIRKTKKEVGGGEKRTLLCLGGGFNPLVGGIQENYLLLIIKILKMSRISNTKIDIIAGVDVASFVSRHSAQSPTWDICTLNHDDVMKKIAYADYFLSVGGQSSTMEALLSGVSLVFFVPSNLSQVLLQVKMMSEIKQEGILWWKDCLPELMVDSEHISEKDFIILIEKVSKSIINDNDKMSLLVSRFNDTLDHLSEDMQYHRKLRGIGEWIGRDGAGQIVDVIESFIK